MSSDFGKAFDELEAKREAEARAKLSQQQEAERLQLLARSIAEPYLTSLGQEALKRLRHLRIPVVGHRRGGLFSRHTGYWPLDPWFRGAGESLNLHAWSHHGLTLTEDGYRPVTSERAIYNAKPMGGKGIASLCSSAPIPSLGSDREKI